MESQILDSATLVSCNGEGGDDDSGGGAIVDLDFEDDGILIMPPDFEDREVHDSLSLPESVPSTVGSFMAANHNEVDDEDSAGAEKVAHVHDDENDGSVRKGEMPEENRKHISTEFVGARSGVTWIGCICFVAMLLAHTLTCYKNSGATIPSGDSSFQTSYDEALLKLSILENQTRDLGHVQKENEELRKTNAHLSDLVHSLRKVQRQNDALRAENRLLEDELKAVNLSREEQNKSFTVLMDEVDRLTADVVKYKARNKEANAHIKESLHSIESLSEERDRLFRKNKRLQGKLKKATKKLDQEDGKSKESFSWQTDDETKQHVIDNCWLQVGLGQCSKDATSSFNEHKQKAAESLGEVQEAASARLREYTDGLKGGAYSFFGYKNNEDGTSKNDATENGGKGGRDSGEDGASNGTGSTKRDHANLHEAWHGFKEDLKGSASSFCSSTKNGTIKKGFWGATMTRLKKDSAEYYGKVQENLFEFVSESMESMKRNQEYYDKVQGNILDFVSESVKTVTKNPLVKSIGNKAKSVFAGIAFATAAGVIVSSTFVGGLFSEDSET